MEGEEVTQPTAATIAREGATTTRTSTTPPHLVAEVEAEAGGDNSTMGVLTEMVGGGMTGALMAGADIVVEATVEAVVTATQAGGGRKTWPNW